MKFRIMTKLLTGYLTVVLLLAVVAFVSLDGLNTVTAKYQRLSKEINVTQLQARTLQEEAVEAARAVYGYLLTQNPQYRADYDKAGQKIGELESGLHGTVKSDKGKEILARVEKASKEFDAAARPIFGRSAVTEQEKADLVDDTLASRRTELMAAVVDLVDLGYGLGDKVSAEADQAADEATWLVLVVSVIAGVAGICFAIFMARGISRPVVAVADTAKRVAAGDLTVPSLKITTRDEVGGMANAFNQMVDNLRDVLQQVSLGTQTVLSTSEELSASSEAAAQAAGSSAQAITQVAAGANEQSRGTTEANETAGQLQDAIQQIAVSAGKASGEVQDAAALLDQMAVRLDDMTKNATVTAEGVSEAVKQARAGADVVERTLQEIKQIGIVVVQSAERIKDLDQISGQIGAITEVISSIADQTNLLALNAAIEAARAGEHGRGFAVVADEVRKLAERSATSSKEITDLIHNIQTGTAEAVKAMDAGTNRVDAGNRLAAEAGVALDEILRGAQQAAAQVGSFAQAASRVKQDSERVVRAINEVAASAEQNTAATEEMAASVTEVTNAVNRIAQVSQENAAASEEVSASVEELTASSVEVASAAQGLARTAQDLQDQVNRFKL